MSKAGGVILADLEREATTTAEGEIAAVRLEASTDTTQAPCCRSSRSAAQQNEDTAPLQQIHFFTHSVSVWRTASASRSKEKTNGTVEPL